MGTRTDDRHTPLVHKLGMKRCMALVEAFSKKCRAENELRILQQEMRAFQSHYEEKEQELMGHLSNCDKHLQGIVNCRVAEGADHELCTEDNMFDMTSSNTIADEQVVDNAAMMSFFPTTSNSSTSSKYIVSDENLKLHDETFVRGVRAVLANSLHRVVRPMLRHAREEFSRILAE